MNIKRKRPLISVKNILSTISGILIRMLRIFLVAACVSLPFIIKKLFFPDVTIGQFIWMCLTLFVYIVVALFIVMLIVMIGILAIGYIVLIIMSISNKIKAYSFSTYLPYTENDIKELINQGIVTDGKSFTDYVENQLSYHFFDKKLYIHLKADDIQKMKESYRKVFYEEMSIDKNIC